MSESKLAETYLNIDAWVPESSKFELISYVYDSAKRAAKSRFDQDLNIEVHYKDGSIRIWAVYLGALYIAIGQYGSFRSGVDAIIKDARIVSELGFEDFRKEGMKSNHVRRKERRLGAPGRLGRALREIEWNSEVLDAVDFGDLIRYATKDLSLKDSEYVASNLIEYFEERKQDPWNNEGRSPLIALRPEDYYWESGSETETLGRVSTEGSLGLLTTENYIPSSARKTFHGSDRLPVVRK